MAGAHITFIRSDGSESLVEAGTDGESVMVIARRAGVDGIVAECGGNLSCATCHVYIDQSWIDRLPRPQPLESAMLECAVDKAENSRLSCQIRVSRALDGLIVRVPDRQF